MAALHVGAAHLSFGATRSFKCRKTAACSGIGLWRSAGGVEFSAIATGNSRAYGLAQSSRRQLGICKSALEALIFDCDGVILESEDLHRRAYNATFEEFDVKCPGSLEPVNWSSEFYDELQNQIGGGKPKMRYFGVNGWPTSSRLDAVPESEDDKATLINALQDWKTEKYKDLLCSDVTPRPGVVELMDEARASGLKIAVCSAATKSSVVFCLTSLLGTERFEELDCFLAGDDVDKKKPDPSIYRVAAERLGVAPARSLVIEDSVIGLKAAIGAGMSCIITYTSSTSNQDFSEAAAVFPDLGGVRIKNLFEIVGAAQVVS